MIRISSMTILVKMITIINMIKGMIEHKGQVFERGRIIVNLIRRRNNIKITIRTK